MFISSKRTVDILFSWDVCLVSAQWTGYGVFTRFTKRPANFQQFTCILNTFAGRLLDRVNTLLVSPVWALIGRAPKR